MSRTETCTSVLSGKRKRESALVLHLSGGSTCESDNDAVSEFSPSGSPIASSSNNATVIVNGKIVANVVKPYQCTFEGCVKSYKKPARLEEHERTHTGERPFICTTCQKTYFRDTHLQAHMRSHMPDSSRPFACTHLGCDKKFWTSQHLKRHAELHSGGKPFKCTEPGCLQSFSKHHQLRSHFASQHCPPGTKIFVCEYQGCTKSFVTSQKLKAHARTHEERRYTCSHAACLRKETQEFFPTWTALQTHSRTAHPPTCPYPSCKGKTFTQQKGLRAHLKLHEQREIEEALDTAGDADDEGDNRPIKRRRGGEVGRDWKCLVEGCEKDFKSRNALETHIKVAHFQRRDFMCPVEGCGASFGYKHLLQRHAARTHLASGDSETAPHAAAADEALVEEARPAPSGSNIIDLLTGKAYEDRAKTRLACQNSLICPYPDMPRLGTSKVASWSPTEPCASVCPFVFTRAYDLRRHLSAGHGLEVDRETAAAFVESLRHRKEIPGDGPA